MQMRSGEEVDLINQIINSKKINSIDISHIEKSTPYKNITLSESYITKIEDTTNEDFAEILNLIDEKRV